MLLLPAPLMLLLPVLPMLLLPAASVATTWLAASQLTKPQLFPDMA